MTDSRPTLESLKKIAEGREAEMFEWRDGQALRLFRAGHRPEEAVRQLNFMQEAASAGVPVPKVFGLQSVDGRAGFVMERLHGPDLLNVVGTKPWRVFRVSADCGRVHAAINSAPAPSALPTNHERMRRILSRSSADMIPALYSDAARAALEHLDEGDRLCHGDFHPGNVMFRDGEAVVIDWSNAVRGVPEADFARTRVMIKLGDPPPGTPTLVRFLARHFRRLFLVLYSRAYRKAIHVDEDLVRAWEFPVAVARLGENIPEERRALIAYIESRLPHVA